MKDVLTSMSYSSLPRRLARRGGVKRISATIYDDVRAALKDRLTTVGFPWAESSAQVSRLRSWRRRADKPNQILRDCVTYVEYRKAKTVTVYDVSPAFPCLPLCLSFFKTTHTDIRASFLSLAPT